VQFISPVIRPALATSSSQQRDLVSRTLIVLILLAVVIYHKALAMLATVSQPINLMDIVAVLGALGRVPLVYVLTKTCAIT
jgi:hypothetical protein